MKRWFRRLFALLLLVLLAFAVLFGISRALGPTQAQRDAAARMQDMPTPANNGYAALRFLAHPVPSDAVDALLVEESRAIRDWLPSRSAGNVMPPDIAAMRYGPAAHTANPPDCSALEPGCLASMRANRDAYAARLRAEADLIDRTEGLARFDALHLPADQFAAYAASSPPLASRLGVLQTKRAFDFVDGRQADAIGALCSDVATLRRFASDANLLIVTMLLDRQIEGQTRLFADMLAEWPEVTPLPATCATAFAPPTGDELSPCRMMQGELAFMSALLDGMPSQDHVAGKAVEWALYDRDATLAIGAEQMAPACGPEIAAAVAGDIPVRWPAPPPRAWRFECIGNVLGCDIAGVSAAAHEPYVHRRQDIAALLRLADVLQRLHASAPDPRPLMVRVRDADTASATSPRQLRISADGATLELPRYWTGRGDTAGLPIPPPLRDSPPAPPAAQSAGSHSAK